MKRTGIVLAGAVIAAALIYVGRMWAQPTAPARPAAPLRTRIALVNLHYVIPKYQKYQTFQNEMKKALEPYQVRDKEKRALLEKVTQDAQKPENASKREQLEADARNLKRELEDNQATGNKMLQHKSEEQLKILYEDVRTAATRYAQAHDFELVFSYNEGITEAEYYSPPNILRKLRDGGCTPMYFGQGMDVSEQIVQILNGAFGRPTTPTAAR